MKSKYIMPAITVCDIETESMFCIASEWGQVGEGLAKRNNRISFDRSIEDEEDDDDCGFSWSCPMYFGIKE